MTAVHGEGGDDFFTARDVPRRRRSGPAKLLVVLLGLVVVLGLLVVAAELVLRPIAEARAATELEQALPDTATGGVDVDIHGWSLLLQALRGSVDDVTVTGDDLELSGVPVGLRVDITDVPVDGQGTTGPSTGSLTVDQESVNALQAVQDTGGSLTLGSSTVTYDRSFEVPLLGEVPVRVEGRPDLSGDGRTLTLTPTAASVPGSGLQIDEPRVLGTFAFDLCVAQYLPEQLQLTDVVVEPSRLTLDLRSDGLPLSSSAFSSRGSC